MAVVRTRIYWWQDGLYSCGGRLQTRSAAEWLSQSFHIYGVETTRDRQFLWLCFFAFILRLRWRVGLVVGGGWRTVTASSDNTTQQRIEKKECDGTNQARSHTQLTQHSSASHHVINSAEQTEKLGIGLTLFAHGEKKSRKKKGNRSLFIFPSPFSLSLGISLRPLAPEHACKPTEAEVNHMCIAAPKQGPGPAAGCYGRLS
ncbi:hypothetical protein J3E68DRAFT_412834 [Trichoderma sp. SZMC 28012]